MDTSPKSPGNNNGKHKRKPKTLRPVFLFFAGVFTVFCCYSYQTLALNNQTGGGLLGTIVNFFTSTPQALDQDNPEDTALYEANTASVKQYAAGSGIGALLLSQHTAKKEMKVGQLQQEKDTIPNSYFNRSAFIGDSRTEGFLLYNGLIHAGNYGIKAMTVDGFFNKEAIPTANGGKTTIAQDIAGKQFDSFYLMFGMNELGWASEKVFISKYGQVIDAIRQKHPDSEIIVQSILPVSAEKSANDQVFNNPNINRYNQLLQQMCQEKSVTYLDISDRFKDEEGALFADASTDGIHLNKKYCNLWLDYLKEQVALNRP